MRRLLATLFSTMLVVSVLSVMTASTASAATYNFFGGHRYKVVEKYLSWPAAARYCEKRGSYLVTINSAEEDDFVYRLKPDTWLGATDEVVEGEWRWESGEPFTYTNWAPGEPNNSNADHYLFYTDGGAWNDIELDNSIQFVCERSQASLLTGIKVTVRCYSNPEKVIIKNNRKYPITVANVGSIYKARAAEPYRVQKYLKPGKSVVYSFGTKWGPNRLAKKFIFNNSAASEGAKLWMKDKGRIKKPC